MIAALRATHALTAAVGATFGPRGAVVHVGEDDTGRPPFTRDGARAARALVFDDAGEHAVAERVIAAAEEVVRGAGDGATATIILASTLVADAVRIVGAGVRAATVCESLERAATDALRHVERAARPMRGRVGVARIATEAAHGDAPLGGLVGRALEYVGPYGHVRFAPRGVTDVDLELDEFGPPATPPAPLVIDAHRVLLEGRRFTAALPPDRRFGFATVASAQRLADEIDRRSSGERAGLYERMGTLTQRCATLRVIAADLDPDAGELESRARRAVCAARSVMRRGVVTGGGLALMRATADGTSLGARMLSDAATAVVASLAATLGEGGRELADRVRGMAGPVGLNVRSGRFENLDQAGIFDPVEVIEAALARSVRLVRETCATHAAIGPDRHDSN